MKIKGDELLTLVLEVILSLPEWKQFKEAVSIAFRSSALRECRELTSEIVNELSRNDAPSISPRLSSPRPSSTSEFDTLIHQIILEFVGNDIRSVWNDDNDFKPETLVPPSLIPTFGNPFKARVRDRLLKLTHDLLSQYSKSSLYYELKSAAEKNLLKVMESGSIEEIYNNKVENANVDHDSVIADESKAREATCDVETDQVQSQAKYIQIGEALSILVRKQRLVNLLVTLPRHYESPSDIDEPVQKTLSTSTSLSSLSTSSLSITPSDDTSASDILSNYNPASVSELCKRLAGSLLSSSLRQELFAFLFLHRLPSDPPSSLLLVRELSRLSTAKKIPLWSEDDVPPENPTPPPLSEKKVMEDLNGKVVSVPTPPLHHRLTNLPSSLSTSAPSKLTLSDLIRVSVKRHIQLLFPLSLSKAAQTSSSSSSLSSSSLSTSSFHTLEKRAAVLIQAAYILMGIMSDRIVCVSLFLLNIYPTEAPNSEKFLQILRRIVADCLPSEQLHRDYSLSSTANQTFDLLQQVDSVLHAQLFNLFNAKLLPPQQSASEGTNGSEANSSNNDAKDQVSSGTSGPGNESKKDSSTLPPSLLLLKGWFETGFLGYIPEHAALFVWDQLILRGSRPETFQRLLPQISCALLVLLRDKFLESKEWVEGETLLRGWGQRLPTKSIVEALKKLDK